MGMYADDFLSMVAAHEADWDDYVTGYMSDEDAFEAGIIDHEGYADSDQLDRVIDRNPIPTLDALDNQLEHAEKDLQTVSKDRSDNINKAINDAAIVNLYKPQPTCNWCGEMMQSRTGKFGKFYFCECPDQPTVSHEYWESVRIKFTQLTMADINELLNQYGRSILQVSKNYNDDKPYDCAVERSKNIRKQLEQVYEHLLNKN